MENLIYSLEPVRRHQHLLGWVSILYSLCFLIFAFANVKLVSLVNAERASVGLPTVGFINPALYYANSSMFNDITSGNTHCGSFGTVCCDSGFSAKAGWDPTTGLGSINYPNLRAILISDVAYSPTTKPSTQPFLSNLP